jgi:hypothetical protein
MPTALLSSAREYFEHFKSFLFMITGTLNPETQKLDSMKIRCILLIFIRKIKFTNENMLTLTTLLSSLV